MADELNETENKAYETAMAAMRALDLRGRRRVLAAIRYNDEFCSECGSVTAGRTCYCTRDD